MNNREEILDNIYQYLNKYKKDYETIILKNGLPGYIFTYIMYYDEIKLIADYIIELQNKIDKTIKYIKENSWYCYKDNEENLDRIGIEHILELLGEDENE